jgi:hypothetical protein
MPNHTLGPPIVPHALAPVSVPLVYIAGPLGAATLDQVAHNIEAAAGYRLPLARAGACPVCPHTMTQELYGAGVGEAFWLDAMLALQRRCDATLLVPGWQDSRGARAECGQAERLGQPAWPAAVHGVLPGGLLDWLARWHDAHGCALR